MSFVTIGFTVWAIFYPYYFSYLKHFNPAVTVEQIFGGTFFLFLGMNVIGIIFPSILFLFGACGTMMFGGLIMLLNCISLYTFTNWFFIILNTLIFGGLYKYTTLLCIIYFNEHFPERGSILHGIALTGFLVGSIFSSVFCTYMINPDNKEMTTYMIDGVETIYFDYTISYNLVNYLNYMGFAGLIVCLVSATLLEDPEKYTPNIREVINYVRGLDNSMKDAKRVFNESLNNTFSKSIVKSDKSNSQSRSYSSFFSSNILSKDSSFTTFTNTSK